MEWRTLSLAAVIYSGWLALTWSWAVLPWPVRIICGGWLAAWHSSLQHEAIHGHPTPWRGLNTAIVMWPLSLWLPYPLYRKSHLAHHAAEVLTVPGQDPETHYRAPARNRLGRLDHALSRATSTLLGRLTLGPAVLVGRFAATELAALRRTPARCWIWVAHAVLVSGVLTWVMLVCRISLGAYVLGFVYPGAALGLLRAFAEHRADPEPGRRVAVVERAPVLGLLFLNNNLHVLHHQQPRLAWYDLPRTYRSIRVELREANGDLVYRGYRELFARFLLRPHDRLVHPGFDPPAAP